jgi:hypothetical protein
MSLSLPLDHILNAWYCCAALDPVLHFVRFLKFKCFSVTVIPCKYSNSLNRSLTTCFKGGGLEVQSGFLGAEELKSNVYAQKV